MNTIKIFYSNRKRKKFLLKEEELNEMIVTKKFKKKNKNFFSLNYIINSGFLLKILFPTFIILLFIYLIIYLYVYKKKQQKKNYFACFCSKARQENRYARQLIPYYLKLGVNKFIFLDNNLNNTEKLSDVLGDYKKSGLVDIYDLFGSKIGQSEFFEIVYEKYKNKCKWFLFFDFDEYLEMHFENNKSLILNEFLPNPIFNNCEAILFNWLIYSDNDLVYYDNRSLLERFTEPYFACQANMIVKPIVRGGLNKTIFYPNSSNHVPHRNVTICDSMGRRMINYNNLAINPPIFKYGFLKHFNTKTADEYSDKIKRGANRNLPYNINERVKTFFKYNKFTEEKMKVFEKKLNKTFNRNGYREGFRGN